MGAQHLPRLQPACAAATQRDRPMMLNTTSLCQVQAWGGTRIVMETAHGVGGNSLSPISARYELGSGPISARYELGSGRGVQQAGQGAESVQCCVASALSACEIIAKGCCESMCRSVGKPLAASLCLNLSRSSQGGCKLWRPLGSEIKIEIGRSGAEAYRAG